MDEKQVNADKKSVKESVKDKSDKVNEKNFSTGDAGFGVYIEDIDKRNYVND
jgi:hypothetical protein